MKLRFLKYGILVSIAFMNSSCEKDVKNVHLPPFEKKLAIVSFISPSDSGIFVFVKSNQRLYGDLSIKEQTGVLSGTISDGSREVELDTTANGLYVKSDKIAVRYGTTYTLKVNNDDGLTATGICTVPEKRVFDIRIDSVKYVTHTVQFDQYHGYVYNTMDFQLSFTDYPGEQNFYRLRVILQTYKTDTIHNKQYKTYSDLYIDKEYFTDTGADGTRIINKESVNSYETDYSKYDSAFLKIYLYNTEKSYYLYHISLGKYDDEENPFTEVTPVYSNISGGLGVFTSYTVDSLVYNLK
jgi:hypothetical protein